MKKYWWSLIIITLICILASCSEQKSESIINEKKLWENTEHTKNIPMMQETSRSKEEESKESPEQQRWESKNTENMHMPMSENMQKEEIKKTGIFTAYKPELVWKTEKTVLFFHADWCPSCRAADIWIGGDTIPANLSILKVDYDTSDELKKKYWVLSQHTFVQVDKEWNMLEKWVGWTHVSDIEENLK